MNLKILTETIQKKKKYREKRLSFPRVGERGIEKIFEELEPKFSKLDGNYKCTDPRSSINLRHQKHKENYTNIHHNPIAKNQ